MGLPFELFCPFYAITGLYCPLCGLMRAVAALARLDVPAAFGHNPLVVLALPVLAYLIVRWALERAKLARLPWPQWPKWSAPALLIVVAAFWIARNVPVYPFTLLAP